LQLFEHRQRVAIAAVIDIAINEGAGRPVQAREIASRLELSKRYLEPILQALVHRGILSGKRSTKGGYQLGRESLLISVEDILRASTETSIEKFEDDLPLTIEEEVVTAAIRPAEDAFSKTLRDLTIDVLVRLAVTGDSRSGEDRRPGADLR
jgi:Rrf2 family iron-sulfur cluster assembly transcriptional regulator